MSSKLSTNFATAFEQLTGRAPFPWQVQLYRRFTKDSEKPRIPSVCQIPTGLGKTSLIAVWLIALRHGARLPRRLVYVVNRRTVVDQATEEVERIRRELGRFEHETQTHRSGKLPAADRIERNNHAKTEEMRTERLPSRKSEFLPSGLLKGV